MSKPRKAYKPKAVSTNPLRAAINAKSVMTPDERNEVMGLARQSFVSLRQGKACRQDWCYLADAANVSEALSDIGICSDDASRSIAKDMQQALKSIAERINASGVWAARGPELVVIEAGLDRHEIQLTYCSIHELKRACEAVKSKISRARAGRIDTVTIVEGAA